MSSDGNLRCEGFPVARVYSCLTISGEACKYCILSCLEAAINRTAKEYSRYGSATHKQVYIYGRLDTSPAILNRNFGMAWGVGGWLLFPFLQKNGQPAAQRLRERVVAELKTTFASHYTKEISLAEALSLEEIAVYGKRATGAKYLINPNKGIAAAK